MKACKILLSWCATKEFREYLTISCHHKYLKSDTDTIVIHYYWYSYSQKISQTKLTFVTLCWFSLHGKLYFSLKKSFVCCSKTPPETLVTITKLKEKNLPYSYSNITNNIVYNINYTATARVSSAFPLNQIIFENSSCNVAPSPD